MYCWEVGNQSIVWVRHLGYIYIVKLNVPRNIPEH